MSSVKLSTDQDTGNRLNKLKEIIDKNFNDEIDYKQAEIDKITQVRLNLKSVDNDLAEWES
jgi:hypothetical protein